MTDIKEQVVWKTYPDYPFLQVNREIKNNIQILSDVIVVDFDHFMAFRFKSQMEASRVMGVRQEDISSVIKGRLNQIGSYWFTYADSTVVERTRKKFGNKMANKVEKLMIEREQKG